MMNYIEIAKLQHHPLNPRSDFGDVTELADSMKINGVLQNLTVVGGGDMYSVVIGNRRLEAAKLAGLVEVPCEITDLTDFEIMSMMLQENMLRKDLSRTDESKGIRSMKRGGMSVKEIAEMTGFSESTVRSRDALADYDAAKVEDAFTAGATLFDFAELGKIDDEEKRKEILEKSGTKNFKSAIKSAIEEQEAKEYLEKAEQKCIDLGAVLAPSTKYAGTNRTKITLDDGTEIVAENLFSWSRYSREPEPESFDFNGQILFYAKSAYSVSLYQVLSEDTKVVEDAKEIERQIKRSVSDEHRDVLEALEQKFEALRKEFVTNYSAAKKNAKLINAKMFDELVFNTVPSGYAYADKQKKIIEAILGEGYDLAKSYEEQPEFTALVLTYANAEALVKHYGNCVWESASGLSIPKHNESASMDKLYAYLVSLGYEISDEEEAYKSGLHNVFDDSWADAFRPVKDEKEEETE